MSSKLMATEPTGNGEFHDIDAEVKRAQEADSIVLDRDTLVLTVAVLKGYIAGTGAKMANGAPSTRFCKMCATKPSIAHNPGNVMCKCVCHVAHDLVTKLEAL